MLHVNPERPDDMREAKQLLRYRDYAALLSDIADEMRRRLKYLDEDDKLLTLSSFSAWVWERLNEEGIDPYEE